MVKSVLYRNKMKAARAVKYSHLLGIASASILNRPRGSAFNAWPRSMNFSPGTHTLQITKVYVEPRGPGRPKPMFVRVPAYELTYNVRYTDTGIVSPG
jgi:hypothetical protein